ncbi:Thiopurine S-methyltransferase [hydrothermal vent metagenome]|uniref:thiopurine S-methyltransferase n=1 Tax=hydrothermal vent metagenome TaxID=652676 RepID=A0A3B0V7A6_9ZZZZ
MEKEFWIEKWQNNQIGFHKDKTHPLLIKYIDRLQLCRNDTVFVPLCGKTVDMLWLNAQGYKVLGVELSTLAVEQFFQENNLVYKQSQDGLFNVYTYENITIYQGDFFAMTDTHCIDVSAVYDRAALIALPDELVEKYVQKMNEIIPDTINELLITLEFVKTSGAVGPPFSTPDNKVQQLFENCTSIKLLQKLDIIAREPRFQSQGCEYVYERAYLLGF